MTGPLEILILLLVVFLIFGPRRITNLFRALGRGARDFAGEIDRKINGKELPDKEEEESPDRR